jgi:hypothetical protein
MNVRVRPPTRLLTTVADLENWLAVATPGDSFAYYKGYLAMDRGVGSRLGERDRKELCRVADAVMVLAQSGHVHPVQRRNGPGDFTYIAIASSSIRRSPARTPVSETAA